MSEPMELRGVDLVVIPAYQPSALLLDLVKDVTAAGYGAVVVDDGSTMDRQWIPAGGGGSPPPAKPGEGGRPEDGLSNGVDVE